MSDEHDKKIFLRWQTDHHSNWTHHFLEHKKIILQRRHVQPSNHENFINASVELSELKEKLDFLQVEFQDHVFWPPKTMTLTAIPILKKLRKKRELSSDLLTVPPIRAEIIMRFVLPKSDRDSLLGDLEEEYRYMLAKFGIATARKWYWAQCGRTVAAYVWSGFSKFAKLALLTEAARAIWQKFVS